MVESIKTVLMRRDGITADQADSLINEAIEQMHEYIDNNEMEAAENICEEFFGLEPDYIDELI